MEESQQHELNFRMKPWQTVVFLVLWGIQCMGWVLTGIFSYFAYQDYSSGALHAVHMMSNVALALIVLSGILLLIIVASTVWHVCNGEIILCGYLQIKDGVVPPAHSSVVAFEHATAATPLV